MADVRGCDEIRGLIPELAMGVASGEERERALAHVARCPECRAELADMTALVDDLLLLTPEHEPAAGFDARVLSHLEPRRPSRAPGILLAVAAALLVAAVAGGLTWRQGANDRELAAQYRDTLAVADGSYLRAAA
ncbi:MAG: zf-HC2 domain-containing protein [Nocardioidaceae bacterium]